MLKNRFFFTPEGEVRVPWVALILLAAWQLSGLLFIRLLVALDRSDFMVSSFLNLAVALGVVVALLAFRFLFSKPLSHVGFGDSAATLKQAAVGALLAAGFVVTMALILGDIQWQPRSGFDGISVPASIAGQAVRYLAGSFFEETIATALIVLLLFSSTSRMGMNAGKGMFLAIAASSLVFGLLHGFNPNATPVGTFNLVLFGLITSLALASTGNIAFPIAFHASWNLFQNVLFNLPNSGKPSQTSLFEVGGGAPPWVSGGSFGIEGSYLILAAFLGLAFFLLWRWKRQGWKQGVVPI